MQLIIDTYGAYLSCKDGMFQIKTEECETHRFPVREVNEIMIGKGVAISSDALFLALAQEVRVVFAGKDGRPEGTLWNGKFGSVSTIRRRQLSFTESDEGREWVRRILLERMGRQETFLGQTAFELPGGEALLLPLAKSIEGARLKLQSYQPDNGVWQPSFRGYEGIAAAAYFKGLSAALPKEFAFDRNDRRPAKGMFNAALNYINGILYARVESELIRAGLDPAIGVLHADQYNKPVLVYDFIEQFRHWAEHTVFGLFMAGQINWQDFIPTEQGLWLGKTGKQKLIPKFADYMELSESFQKRDCRRSAIVGMKARQLAAFLLKNEI